MEEKRIYYVGIDHGNHLMKTSNHVFENGVERQAVKPTFQANTLVYDGAFYKIGEKRNSVKDSKLADDDYYLLTLAALAKECQSGNIPNGARVVLGVGLPLKQFATVRKQFVKYLKRGSQPVHFKFEDVAYEFTIENVLAFPQCYAAVADRLGSMKGEHLIVDVGSWTIDIMHVKDGVPVESKCETFTESMISVIQEIKSRSSGVFGKEISENVITDYISNLGGNYPEKYARIMDEALEKFVSRVEGILKENGHDTEFTNIIYVGGGAKAMERFGKHGDNISYVTDVRANAKGYEFLAKQMAHMVMGFRERRLGCRLYMDRQSDANILKKLDRMLVDGSFLNQTELIKRGIELAYEEAYGEAEEVKASHRQEIDVKKFAEEVARALKPEMEKLMAECEARVAATETPAPPTSALASMHDAPKDNTASVTDDEVIIPSQTFNFLKGLNDD